MASLRRIQLIRTPQEVFNPYTSLAFRFTVLATNGYLIDNNIFKMVNRPLDPASVDLTVTVPKFIGVCTPGDMANLPINNPPLDDPTAPYRLGLIDVTFVNEVSADNAWAEIQEEATNLVNALNAQDDLVNPVSIWIGPPP